MAERRMAQIVRQAYCFGQAFIQSKCPGDSPANLSNLNSMRQAGTVKIVHARGKDLAVNVCKEKKKTNVRSSTSDIAIKLTPAFKVSLEEAMSLINDDELLEVTPKNIRMRKKLLTQDQRVRAIHTASRKAQEEAE